MDEPWRELSRHQAGVLARRQLTELGVSPQFVRRRIVGERWQEVTSTVVCTSTGPLADEQRMWVAALHCGGASLVGGLTAARVHGLRGWDRPDLCVLVDDERTFDPLRGFCITRTRRPLSDFRDPRSELPLCRLEPAVLLYAGYTHSLRTATGLLAACVQQRITSVDRLGDWLQRMRPLRRSKVFAAALDEMAGGVQSVAELDVRRICRRAGIAAPRRQVRRRDSGGRLRYTDCEWQLSDGRVVVLEVDGSFHMDVEHWEDDLARQRALTGPGRLVVRATSRELRDEPEHVVRDLIRLGVPGRGPQVTS